MAKIKLQAVPLTRANFARFGDVIETSGAEHFPINAGTVERFHDLANVDINSGQDGRPLISIMQTTQATRLPAPVTLVERHPLGSQAFIPLFSARLVIVVAPAGDAVDPHSLQAFVTNGQQGYNYHRGTWHMPLITPEVGQQTLIVDRGGPGNNCDEWQFSDEIVVHAV